MADKDETNTQEPGADTTTKNKTTKDPKKKTTGAGSPNGAKAPPADESLQVPEAIAAFAELLKKFAIGTEKSPIKADVIADNISRTGGEFVFEDPAKLAERLATWHDSIPPTKRKQIMEQWFAEKNVPIPPEVMNAAMVSTKEVKKSAEDLSKDEALSQQRLSKFAVDPDTNTIRTARADEKGLTMGEAQDLVKENQKAKTANKDKDDAKAKAAEGPFMIDEDGNMTIRPGASLTAQDLLSWEAMRKAREGGDARSPMEILTEKMKEFEMFAGLAGLKTSGAGKGDITDDVEKMIRLKNAFSGDDETKKLLAGIYNQLSTGGGAGSAEVKALEGKLADLQKLLDDREKQDLRNMVQALNDRLSGIQQQMSNGSSKDEYGIMNKGLETIDKRFGAMETLILQIFGKGPAPLKEGESLGIKAAIAAEGGKTAAARDLGSRLFLQAATPK